MMCYPMLPERYDWLEPDAPSRPIGYCVECKRDIFFGDDIWEIRGDWYCEDCIDECHREAETDVTETEEIFGDVI